MMSKKKTYGLSYVGKAQRFAKCVVVGDMIFLSGSSGRTMETGEVSSPDVKEQVKVALDKISAVLTDAGSHMDNIVKVQIFIKDMSQYEEIKQAEFDYYEEHAPGLFREPPASTVVQIDSLSKDNMLVECDVTATT